MSDRIAVTGVAVLTPLGDGLEAFGQALREGRDAIAPADEAGGVGQALIADFDPARYATVRGMRVYHRNTQLGICAAKLALDDAGLEPEQLDADRFGIVTASTYAHLDTLLAYDESLLKAGVQRTNPTLMPLGLPSAPGAAVALAFAAKAFSITLSDGGASSLAALGLGAHLVADDRGDVCVVVAGGGPSADLVAAAREAGMTASADEFRVLDEQSCGMAFGEAAAAFVLERADRARARGAAARALVAGHANRFAADPKALAAALERACTSALRTAGVAPSGLALAGTGADGLPSRDAAEAEALLSVLGPEAGRCPIAAVKANLGETFDAAGLLQSAAAVSALQSGTAAPVARLSQPALKGLCYPLEATALGSGATLLTSTSFTGACSALVLTRPDER